MTRPSAERIRSLAAGGPPPTLRLAESAGLVAGDSDPCEICDGVGVLDGDPVTRWPHLDAHRGCLPGHLAESYRLAGWGGAPGWWVAPDE